MCKRFEAFWSERVQPRLHNEHDEGQFETTCWGTLRRSSSRDEHDARPAVAALCTRYRPVILACVSRRVRPGYDEDAEDLTQGFFVHVLERGLFSRADPARGRFRAFLLTSLRHYIQGVRDRQAAAKRGYGHLPVPLGETEVESGAGELFAEHRWEEAIFDRDWAETLVAHVLDCLVEEYSVRGNEKLVSRALPYLHAESEKMESYEDAAAGLGISVSAFRSALNRVRARHRQLLRTAVAETVSGPEEIDAEIRYLCAALGATNFVS